MFVPEKKLKTTFKIGSTAAASMILNHIDLQIINSPIIEVIFYHVKDKEH